MRRRYDTRLFINWKSTVFDVGAVGLRITAEKRMKKDVKG